MAFGYHGRILHVDLTREKILVESPPLEFYRKYLGGSAMGLYYLLNELPPRVEPLGPDNILTFMLSVLTGAPISGQSRMTANAKSPLVTGIGDAQCGGFFPAELKFAGFDGIVLRGRANRPVYLWVHEGEYEMRDAAHLWGKITGDSERMIREELGDERVEIAQIGPAGENLVRIAAIMNMSNRANGRCGLGAVMGSKNLKAVAVRGKNKRLPLADPKRVQALAKSGASQVQWNPDVKSLAAMGTAGVVSSQHMTGTLPTRNFGEGQFEDFEPISGEVMTETILKERDTCYSCSVRCKRVVETEFQNRPVLRHYGGPEYETIATFGSYCAVSDLDAVALASQLCNQFGMDTIGCGATIAWAMDCFELGLISEHEVGFPLHFGDAQAMLKLTELIANREGFGDILAEGSARAAVRLGRGQELLTTVKGSESPAHMPQAKRSLGLIYAVNAFGADHQSSEHDPMIEEGSASELYMGRQKLLGFDRTLAPRSLDRDKVRYAFRTQQMYSFLDSADLCQFVYGPAWTLYGPAETVEVVKAVTGWDDFSLEEMLLVGERRINMMRLFNAREGLDREDDKLPPKYYKALKGTGPTAGVALDADAVEHAKDMYYDMAGWDQEHGLPGAEVLSRLGLEWAA